MNAIEDAILEEFSLSVTFALLKGQMRQYDCNCINFIFCLNFQIKRKVKQLKRNPEVKKGPLGECTNKQFRKVKSKSEIWTVTAQNKNNKKPNQE